MEVVGFYLDALVAAGAGPFEAVLAEHLEMEVLVIPFADGCGGGLSGGKGGVFDLGVVEMGDDGLDELLKGGDVSPALFGRLDEARRLRPLLGGGHGSSF